MGHYHRSSGDVLAWDAQLQLSHQVTDPDPKVPHPLWETKKTFGKLSLLAREKSLGGVVLFLFFSYYLDRENLPVQWTGHQLCVCILEDSWAQGLWVAQYWGG